MDCKISPAFHGNICILLVPHQARVSATVVSLQVLSRSGSLDEVELFA
jgi:hypothetical protein